MSKFIFGVCVMFAVSTADLCAQRDIYVDWILSDNMIENSSISKHPLLDDIGITPGQFLVLAQKHAFFFVGYGGAMSMDMPNKDISTFCVVGNEIYFANGQNLCCVNLLKAKTINEFKLHFTPLRMWGGTNLVYASEYRDNKYLLYAIQYEKKICFEIVGLDSPIVSVAEYDDALYVITTKKLYSISLKGQKCLEMPVKIPKEEVLMSLTFDVDKSTLYLSSNKGIYRVFNKQFQKVCDDTGIIRYDGEGLVVFNSQLPCIFRLRDDILYPKPNEIRIEIK